jgi:uncharacterized membrane protein YhhN
MLTWLPIPLLYGTLFLLLRAERQVPRDERQLWIWKPLTTLGVIAVAALAFARPQGTTDTTYTVLVLGGLLLSLAGDLLLIPQENARAFLLGLVAFLCAHLIYIAAFIYLQVAFLDRIHWPGELVDGVALVVVGVAVYRYLRPGLGGMRLPVIGYVVAISVMVHRALGVAWVHPGPRTQPLLIALGALLFYVSDAILAVNKFRMDGQMANYRLYNLSTYYTGQLLIALSTWFF